jgi:predicted DNA-binding ribbon-helix-helix protein
MSNRYPHKVHLSDAVWEILQEIAGERSVSELAREICDEYLKSMESD